MSWVRVDDAFPWHPKVLGLPAHGVALWLRALCWSNQQKTDGVIPREAIAGLALAGCKASTQVALLVAAKLWTERPDGGWLIHGFLDYQASSSERKAVSRAGAARKEASRGVRLAPASPEASTRNVTSPSPPHHLPIPITSPSEILSPPAPSTPADPEPGSDVAHVWSAYLEGRSKRDVGGSPPKLTSARRDLIRRRLRDHPAEYLANAARGVWLLDFNFRGGHTSLDLALRDAKVDRYATVGAAGVRVPDHQQGGRAMVQPSDDRAWKPNFGDT